MHIVNGECIDFDWTKPLASQVRGVLKDGVSIEDKIVLTDAISSVFDWAEGAEGVKGAVENDISVFFDIWAAIFALEALNLNEFASAHPTFKCHGWINEVYAPAPDRRLYILKEALELAKHNLKNQI